MAISVLYVLVVSSLRIALAFDGRANNCSNPSDILNTNEACNYARTSVDEKVLFILYNRNHPNGTRVAPNSTDEALKSAFIENIDVKFVTHGWIENENDSSVAAIRTAYGIVFDYNVVEVGWSPISNSEYVITTFRVPRVGNVVGSMVVRLLELGLTTLDRVHLIGHSLGSHVMGTAGDFVRNSGYGKVARVSGLDPARPFFEGIRPRNRRLDDEDGQFVDVIHTSAGLLGYRQPLGHADFYPNGGTNIQPGCALSFNIFCSHQRSYEFFAESIYNEDAFPAIRCDSYALFQAKNCPNGPIVYMGNPTPPSTRGVFFLNTNSTGNNRRHFRLKVFN